MGKSFSKYNLNDDSHLISEIQSGKAECFEYLFRNYYYGLCRFVAGIIKSSSVAEDIVQDVFLNIWQNKKEWLPQGNIKTYLYKASKNRAINYLKHLTVINNWAESSTENITLSGNNIENEYVQKETLLSINKAIEKLPEKCKVIFMLQRQEGLTYKEISEVLNISLSTVETQMGRALKKIRKLLFPFLS